MKKLTWEVDGCEVPVEWPDLYCLQKTTGSERIAVGARKPIELLCELAPLIGPEFFLLYILVVPRGEGAPGRYESLAMTFDEVEALLRDFEGFLEQDARHQIWIGSTKGNGMLVFERHGVIYAYGPLGEIEIKLKDLKFEAKEILIPGPHSHYYRREFDSESKRILNAIDWYRKDLREGDDG